MPKEEFDFAKQLLRLGEQLLQFLLSAALNGETWTRLFALAFIAIGILCMGWLLFMAANATLESIVKAIEALKNSGVPLPFTGEKKKMVRKRRQFCGVLAADLAYLAKSENWNDQYFTDLEAEVETEGRYYSSLLARWRNWQSDGMRKVKSLVRAIDTSAERAVLLVGEPGSGKSVALRHLAKRLADRGAKSTSSSTPIPLYLNLRELEPPTGGTVTADVIKEFVIENIRRGDSDTSAYVRENWQLHKDDGRWFFLFDSFDEIPAVLHAATGSSVVKDYSEAIRRFLDGMGNCRAVLASREYKGPESLPWQKYRLLPLNDELRARMVGNSFLETDQVIIVNKHLAATRSTLSANPLFLTLLCRYIKDEKRPPANDYELLSRHILRLAERDSEFIGRKFGLTTKELISGAETIAIAFAENPALSLAPRIDEIHAVLAEFFSLDDLERLVAALVDVKIGRTDVSIARSGDRRFTFSHRRYQESLFAEYLAQNPGHLEPVELLTVPRWREYAVTLLQTQDFSKIAPILSVATALIKGEATRRNQVVGHFIQETFSLQNWDAGSATDVIEILQEGLVQRLDDVPAELRDAIWKFLSVPWKNGDHLDFHMVVKLSGLLPGPILAHVLRKALTASPDVTADIAFRQCVFLIGGTEELETLIRIKVADEVLSSKSKTELLRIEAHTSQLPSAIGGATVYKRCVRLRKLLSSLAFVAQIFTIPAAASAQLLVVAGIKRAKRFSSLFAASVARSGWLFGLLAMPVFAVSFMVGGPKSGQRSGLIEQLQNNPSLVYFLSFYGLFMTLVIYLYSTRAEDEKSPFWKPIARFFSAIRKPMNILMIVVPIGAVAVFYFVVEWLGRGIIVLVSLFGLDWSKRSAFFEVGLFAAYLALMLAMSVATFAKIRNKKAAMARLQIACADQDGVVKTVALAKDWDEAVTWLRKFPKLSDVSALDMRSLSALILRRSRRVVRRNLDVLGQHLTVDLVARAKFANYLGQRLAEIGEERLPRDD